MAYPKERNGRYRLAFRSGGKLLKQNLGAVDRRDAEECLARVEENLRLLGCGRLEVSDGADLALFLVSDGKVASRFVAPERLTLDQLRDRFIEARAERLEANTLIHFRHWLRHSASRSIARGLTWQRWSGMSPAARRCPVVGAAR